MLVVKRDGSKVELDIAQIRKQTIDACRDLDNVSYEELELNAQINFTDGIKTSDIQKTLIQTALDNISIDKANYTYVAARLMLYDLYHKIKRVYVGKVEGNVYKAVSMLDTINKNKNIYSDWYTKYTEEEIKTLQEVIKPERDMLFDYSGCFNMINRSLAKNNGVVTELPQYLHMFVAMFAMQNEKNNRLEHVINFYNILSELKHINPTPINSNGRMKAGGLISCLVGSLRDDIDSITDSWKEAALGSKLSAGWGYDLSRLRGLGSNINIYKDAAKGIIPIAKVFNSILVAIDQCGKHIA